MPCATVHRTDRLQPLARRVRGVAFASVLALLAAAVSFTLLPGCRAAEETPARDTREALGTVVSVAAYGQGTQALRDAIDDAYEEMAAVESVLDAHDASSAIGAFNRDPYMPQPLPAEATTITTRVDELGVEEWFSPALLGVTRLYDFEGDGRVPAEPALGEQTGFAATFSTGSNGLSAFRQPAKAAPTGPAPGLDFGGAAKGLALDRAAGRLRDGGAQAGLLTAGSTTVAFGKKPGGEPWRVGIEDPRDKQAMIATVEAGASLILSTSGDYQRFFERDGVRYHHIVDPRTGRPAEGLRSLTVLGDERILSGLDSDILSTALFVAGRERAEEYARAGGLGLVTVDAEGAIRVVQPESGSIRVRRSDG